MKTTINGLRIAAVAAAVPATQLALTSLSSELGAEGLDRVIENTGISSVRIANGLKTSDLCAAAAEALFTATNIDRATVDGIVFVSQTPDRTMPATSISLQHRLGLSRNAAAFDISYGCSGYVYGLLQAALLIGSGACARVLVCAGDVISPLLHPQDRSVRLLFGDGGSATLVEKGADSASFVVHSDGSGAGDLLVPGPNEGELAAQKGGHAGYLHMDGAAVMAFALREVPTILAEMLEHVGWERDDVGLYGLHQANKFILRYLRRKLQIDPAKLPESFADTGNTGPASIPLLLARVGTSFNAAQRAKTVLCGFGVGLSWGAAAVDLSTTMFLPMLEVPALAAPSI